MYLDLKKIKKAERIQSIVITLMTIWMVAEQVVNVNAVEVVGKFLQVNGKLKTTGTAIM